MLVQKIKSMSSLEDLDNMDALTLDDFDSDDEYDVDLVSGEWTDDEEQEEPEGECESKPKLEPKLQSHLVDDWDPEDSQVNELETWDEILEAELMSDPDYLCGLYGDCKF